MANRCFKNEKKIWLFESLAYNLKFNPSLFIGFITAKQKRQNISHFARKNMSKNINNKK